MAKLKNMEGVIEVVARSGKSFKIGEDWYGAFKATQLNGAEKGDTVSFDYEEVNKGGQTFYNIKGDVTIEESEEEDEKPARKPAGKAAPAKAAPARSGGEDNRQRSIVRQNSLTNANNLLSTYYRGQELTGEATELAEQALEIARLFEAYSMVEDV